ASKKQWPRTNARGHAFRSTRRGLIADAARLEDHAAARRHDAFTYHTAVTVRIGAVAAVPAVAVEPRAHAGAHRSDLHAHAAGIRADEKLRTGRRGQSKGRDRNSSKQKLVHRTLLWLRSLLGG